MNTATTRAPEMEVNVTLSRSIAGLLGPTLIAIGISEAMNLRTLTDPPDPVGLVYLNGGLLFVAGLAIVRFHNRWVRGWPVLVTLIGWLFTLGGLSRMLFPQSTQSGDTWVYAMCVALVAIGIVLTFNAYWPGATTKAPTKPTGRKGGAAL